MREEIANLVHPVIQYGLRLKQRLDKGELPDLDTEQAALKRFLGTDSEARRVPEFGGDPGAENSIMASRSGEAGRRTVEHFLGIRYALACWLDEIFILDSAWESRWNERKLEVSLYGTNDRAWKFWEQARRAEARPGLDSMEVFFLCVMLGFRGDLRDELEKLQSWVSAAQGRILKGQNTEWTLPPEVEAPINVPPLHGREKLQTMVLTGGIVLLIVIPVVAFLVVQQIGQ